MMKKNSLLAVIAAAGTGERCDKNFPKQYKKINGKSVIEHAVKPFIDSSYVSKIIIVISKSDKFIQDQDFYNSEKIDYVFGGTTRQESIFNALNYMNKEYKYVITHDAARPNITTENIYKIYEDILNSKSSCSFFYTPIYDSIKKTGKEEKTIDKNSFFLVQTPQISDLNHLKSALKKCFKDSMDCPDESFAIEYSGLKLSKVKGSRSNIKITENDDIYALNKFLVRSGTGFDLHKYASGNEIILGGYKIKCDFKIVAHSDGDVLLHSIADSILGAAGLGDIGKFFPDNDLKNKDLDSSEIIKFCLDKLKELNLKIYNLDVTIICEYPKINPHREKILHSLSNMLNISKSKIGLKATTSEKIGIIGKNKAIAVQSIVNVREK